MRPLYFHKNWHHKFTGAYSDEMKRIGLEVLFYHVFEDLPHPTIYIHDMELTKTNYVNDRTKIMKLMGLETITMILKNIDLIQ
jgi:hypothetical protein